MNINEACGCYSILSHKVQYLPMSRLGPYRHCRHCNSYTKSTVPTNMYIYVHVHVHVHVAREGYM